jgi:transposase InsO family protein
MCRVLEVSRSGYYAWRKRLPSKRQLENVQLAQEIDEIFTESRQTYGSPRIREELGARGYAVGRNRVIRIMQELGLYALQRRRYRSTTDSDHSYPVAQNLLDRRFTVSRPNEVWAADITYLWTDQGWLYLAVILDLYSRRVVGWSMKNHLRSELVIDALDMALCQRAPSGAPLHHSDQGKQYASDKYQVLLEHKGITCSMSRRANCWDNAVVESFFGTLKQELVHRQRWTTRAQLKSAVYEYLEVFYNRRRRHSTLGYVSPAEFERGVA